MVGDGKATTKISSNRGLMSNAHGDKITREGLHHFDISQPSCQTKKTGPSSVTEGYMFAQLFVPILDKDCSKQDCHGSPQAHSLSAWRYGKYGSFGSLFFHVDVILEQLLTK